MRLPPIAVNNIRLHRKLDFKPDLSIVYFNKLAYLIDIFVMLFLSKIRNVGKEVINF